MTSIIKKKLLQVNFCPHICFKVCQGFCFVRGFFVFVCWVFWRHFLFFVCLFCFILLLLLLFFLILSFCIGDRKVEERLGFGLVFRQNKDENCRCLRIYLEF